MSGYFFLMMFLISSTLFAGEQKVLRLKVDHLACESCAEEFRSALSSVCNDLTLDIKQGEAVCFYGDAVTPKNILSKAKKTGFGVKRMD